MARRTWTRLLRATLITLTITLLIVATAVATMDRWLFVVLDPGAFDPSATPPAPDYQAPVSWAATPDEHDGSDVALADSPATEPSVAPADVFYVHPTTWVGSEWNAPVDDPAVHEATTRGALLIQASAFNACCAVHAPRYRQANGRAFTNPNPDGDRAIEVAYADVRAAFDQFLLRIGSRPFIIAGHSQGAVLAATLIDERIAGQELHARLIAAYLPGAPLRHGTLGVPLCDTPLQTGCFTTWHARGPAFEPNGFELDAEADDPMRGRLCVNPITWTTDGTHAPARENAGAIFFDTPAPVVKPAFADAQCVDGVLIVTTLGDLERDFMSTLLLWVMGPENYHPIEYQLFYLDIRHNATARVQAYHRDSPPLE